MTDIPVVIVGAGLVGLSAAVLLAREGVPSMVVERHPGTSIDPKARTFNPRAIEVYRSAGLEPAIRAVPSPVAGHSVLAQAATLAGPELRSFPSGVPDYGSLSPCGWGFIDQNQLEPILAARAEELGVRVRFTTELVGLRVDAGSVTSVLRERSDTGTSEVVSDYVIAADGARSTVRSMLGVGYRGPGVLARRVSVSFRADLRGPVRGRRLIALKLSNPEVQGTLIPLDGDQRWRLSIWIGDDETVEDYPPTRCLRLINAAIGVPGLPVALEEISGSTWEIRGQVAERMRVGRVFVAGDAAHVIPPTGAFGASTGIQDVHNLVWKLAMVHRGVADDRLLETYESERLPVVQLTARDATARFIQRNGEPIGGTVYDPERLSFGYFYRSGAFLAEPGEPGDGSGGELAELEDPRRPSGRPGTRAPHVLVEHDGREMSTLDLMGRGFVLFTGPRATGWARAAEEVSARVGVPISCHRLGHDLRDTGGVFRNRYRIGEADATLVRPDGIIAWRGSAEVSPVDTLADVLSRVLRPTARFDTPLIPWWPAPAEVAEAVPIGASPDARPARTAARTGSGSRRAR